MTYIAETIIKNLYKCYEKCRYIHCYNLNCASALKFNLFIHLWSFETLKELLGTLVWDVSCGSLAHMYANLLFGKGILVSIVSSRCTYCCHITSIWEYNKTLLKILCYDQCLGQDVKLYLHSTTSEIISNMVCEIWLYAGEGTNVIIKQVSIR